MNHLAHFHLAGEDPDLIVGGFLGDFVKGRLEDRFPPAITRGIALHRAIDAFTDQHPVTSLSKSRFSPATRRFAPVMVDIIFDYFLARRWEDFHPASLADFSDNIFSVLLNADPLLPSSARRFSEGMRARRSLLRYGTKEFVAASLTHLSARLSRPNRMAEGVSEFEQQHAALEADFLAFYPALINFRDVWLSAEPQND
ncbi:MAG: DUF479 domain-containing protein [Pseudomonadales bacterium]|nr:DUF479 domain-containing protein [Pseudomonadales bacterium]